MAIVIFDALGVCYALTRELTKDFNLKGVSQHLVPPRQPGHTESALPREVGRFETNCGFQYDNWDRSAGSERQNRPARSFARLNFKEQLPL